MPPSSIPASSVLQQGGDTITGLRCQTNRTLRFYVLDDALNWPLAVRLGASGNRSASLDQEASVQSEGSGSGMFAAIVNLKDEVHYVLHHSPAATLTESLGKKTSKFNSLSHDDHCLNHSTFLGFDSGILAN